MSSFNIWADQLLYYASILFGITFNIIIFYAFYGSSDQPITTLRDQILFYSKFFWFSGALVAISNIIGLTIYGSPLAKDAKNILKLDKNKWNSAYRLTIIYVSRGDNVVALKRAVQSSMHVLDKWGANYQIDIVTDLPIKHKIMHSRKIKLHLVPSKYETSKSAKYKARALHYVVEQHSREIKDVLPQREWVLHLDEESFLTDASVAGIHEFIIQYKNRCSIGQGEIKYNAHNYGANLIITAMDSIRTGDDLGRFRFQFNMLQRPLFGMHGSYILAPKKLEKRLGFDLGGKGSITEDAYFALIASSKDIKFGWVDGFIREQSPFSIRAIIQQRRRWYCGLMLLSFDKIIPWRVRWPLALNMLLWTVAWIGPIVTLLNIIGGGGYFPKYLLIAAALLQGFYASVYMVGAYRNLLGVDVSTWRKIQIYAFSFLLMPISNAIEGVAVLYGIIRPVKTFEVVNKN